MAPTDPIASLIAGTFVDPEDGATIGVPIEQIEIAKSLRDREAELVAGLAMGRRLAMVSDPDTHLALGARLEESLASVATIIPLGLPRHPHADAETLKKLSADCRAVDGIIAVGSGTINDLCKATAHEQHKPYAVFATAPSMNGYTSVNAAITVAGHKKSLAATAARAAFFDLEVLAAAPARMLHAGLGDSLCRATAEADWLLSHLVRGTTFCALPFELLRADEEALCERPEALMAGDIEAMTHLVRALILSGIGMTICGGSYPASQGEHLISHTIEMRSDGATALPLHGEQIAVCTLTMARLQDRLTAGEPPTLAPTRLSRLDVLDHFGPGVGEDCWHELDKKRLDERSAALANERLREGWPKLREALATHGRSADEISSVLERAGAPTTPEDLGWDLPSYRRAVRHAREIRDRYTFLDLAGDCGALDDPDLT